MGLILLIPFFFLSLCPSEYLAPHPGGGLVWLVGPQVPDPCISDNAKKK